MSQQSFPVSDLQPEVARVLYDLVERSSQSSIASLPEPESEEEGIRLLRSIGSEIAPILTDAVAEFRAVEKSLLAGNLATIALVQAQPLRLALSSFVPNAEELVTLSVANKDTPLTPELKRKVELAFKATSAASSLGINGLGLVLASSAVSDLF